MLNLRYILDNIKKPDKLIWTKHALDKCDIYDIDERNVLKEINTIGEFIQFHYWYGYGTKLYIFVESKIYGKYHVIIIHDEKIDNIIIKTVYRPDNRFKNDGKTLSNPNRTL